MDEARGDVHAALHPARVSLHRLVRPVGERHDAQHILHALLEVRAAQAVNLPEKLEIGARAEGGIERQILRHQAVQLLDCLQVGSDIVTANAGGALGGLEYAGQHRDSGGFSGAVGTEQAKDLALLYSKTDAFDG
ncbi:MAG: hypothetical protein BWY25_01599 [Chloroflexi bacterium ADurb.Bin222]|nr:MAG: hypothetical protein BWY25_01599 [Chloroflexi bacterium ADurb.Bin222]